MSCGACQCPSRPPATVFITKRGMGFALAAVGLFVIGDVTRTGWVQIADALLWGTLAASAVVAGLSGARLEMTPRLGWSGSTSRGVARGVASLGPFQEDDVELVVEVGNRRRWPRFGAILSFDLHVNGELTTPDDGSRVRLFIPFIPALGRSIVQGRLPVPRRGLHTVRAGTATFDAPFGLFRRRQRHGGESSLLVYPARVDVALPEALRTPSEGAPKPVAVRMGHEVSGSRPFAPGDLARHVHWRNSARTGRLLTKTYTAAESPVSVLLLGAPSAGGAAERALDDLVRVAAGVVHEWTRRYGTALVLDPSPGAPQPTWVEALGYLARVTTRSVPPLREALRRLGPGATVAVVLEAADRASVDALAAAAPGLAEAAAWLLADGPLAGDLGIDAARALLDWAGVRVELVGRPLPELGVVLAS